nr:MAG TPA_asm: hypothetical protein [Caudoviricetes sp.]
MPASMRLMTAQGSNLEIRRIPCLLVYIIVR